MSCPPVNIETLLLSRINALEEQIAILNNAIFNIGFNTANENALIKIGTTSTFLTPTEIKIVKDVDQISMKPDGIFINGRDVFKNITLEFVIINQFIEISFENLLFTTAISSAIYSELLNVNSEGINTVISYFCIIIPSITNFCSTNNFLYSLNSTEEYNLSKFLQINTNIFSFYPNIIITIDNLSFLNQFNYFSYTPMVFQDPNSSSVCEDLFYNNWQNISFNAFQYAANLNNNVKKIVVLYTLSNQVYKTMNKLGFDETNGILYYVFYISETYLYSYNIWLRTFSEQNIVNNIPQKINYIPNYLLSDYLNLHFNCDVSFNVFTNIDKVSDDTIQNIIGKNVFTANNADIINEDYSTLIQSYTDTGYTNNDINSNFSTQNNDKAPNGIWTQVNVFSLFFDIPDELYLNTEFLQVSDIDELIITCFNTQYFNINYSSITVYNADGDLQPLFTIQTSTDLPIINDPDYPSKIPLTPPSSGTGYYNITFSLLKPTITPAQQYETIQVYRIDMTTFKNSYPDINQISVIERQSYPSCILNTESQIYEPQTLSYFGATNQDYYGGTVTTSSYGNKQVYAPITMRVLTK